MIFKVSLSERSQLVLYADDKLPAIRWLQCSTIWYQLTRRGT